MLKIGQLIKYRCIKDRARNIITDMVGHFIVSMILMGNISEHINTIYLSQK